jgi:hypothetical protein
MKLQQAAFLNFWTIIQKREILHGKLIAEVDVKLECLLDVFTQMGMFVLALIIVCIMLKDWLGFL